MNVVAEVEAAAERLRGRVRETPVEGSPVLSRAGHCRAWLKLESYQLTGSFKVRGAMSKLLALSAEERRRGFVTASSGNHGAAVAYARQELGIEGTIVVPEDASPTKVEAIRERGAEVVVHGADCVIAERWARREAARRGAVYVSPYNDPQVIGGQGTVGVELAHQLERIDAVYVSVGGGGLISGVAGFLRSRYPELEVVGCSPENSAVMAASVAAGRILDLESLPTLSDGTAGGVEEGSITFELCRRLVNRFVLVGEDEIADAMRFLAFRHHVLVEGAAGAAVAAFLEDGEKNAGKDVAIVLCGANVGPDVLRRILLA